MLFSVPRLFEHLLSSSTQHPITLEDLKQSLQVADPDQEAELTIALDALQTAGLIETVAHGNSPEYARRQDDSLVVGRLRCNNRGFCFAIRDEPGVDDIYIHGTNLNGAWNGDQVLARITKDGYRRKPQKSPEGEVAAVIERTNPTLVGKLKQVESQFRAAPLDDRLLFEIELETPAPEQGTPPLEEGQFAYIEVKSYPLADQLPKGRIRKILGSSPESSMDVDLVCCKYDLPQSFSSVVMEAANSLSQRISKTELRKRQDYRDWLTVTIEPLDLQHPHGLEPNLAVSLAITDDGWQLGIHITDAAHWVEPGTPMDREARARGTAVFLDTTVLPLLPPQVQSQVALGASQDRLTLSVLLYLSHVGELQFVEVYPSLIKPRANLTYGYVQALLVSAAENSAEGEMPELMSLLKNLHTVSQLLRQQRHREHGFELQMSDLNPPLTADEDRSGVLRISPTLTAHSMMSEFVIAANRAIGEHLSQLGIPGLYRVQPQPSTDQIQSFLRLAGNMSLDLSLEDPEQVQLSDFQQFCQRIQSTDMVQLGATPALIEQLISTLPTPYHQAGSLEETPELTPPAEETDDPQPTPPIPTGHFGLGLSSPYFTVTAPLHRYADLVNQRALHFLFDKGRDRRSTKVKKGVDLHSSTSHGQINWKVLPPKVHGEWQQTVAESVDPLNQREQIVRRAEQELSGLKKAEYMQKHLGETFSGLVIGVQNYGFFVQIDPILAEGLVHVSSLKNDWYEYRSRQQALVGRKSRKQFRLGDRVEVQIKNVDYYRQQIDLIVVGEGRVYEEDDN